MFRKSGHPEVKNDETAWCSAAANTWMLEAGLNGTGALNARSWLNWGTKLDTAKRIRRGAVLIFKRGSGSWQGHVCFLLADNDRTLEVIGGNQSDQVNVQRVSRANLIGARWPSSVPPPAPKPVEPTKPEPAPVSPPAPVETQEASQPSPPPAKAPVESVQKKPRRERGPNSFIAKALAWLSGGGIGVTGVFSQFSDWRIAAVFCAFFAVVGLVWFLVYWFFFRKRRKDT